MSCPLTLAHVSGAGCFCCLQPASPKRINAHSGNNTAARATPFERKVNRGKIKVGCSGSFLHAACADARRANPHLLLRAVHQSTDAAQIRIPPPPPRVVCVADHVSKMRPFAAQFTLHRHNVPVQSTENVQNASHHSSRPPQVFPLALINRGNRPGVALWKHPPDCGRR